MPIGELPITSYFSRVPQKKRKATATPPSDAPAKRKRPSDSAQASLTFPKAPPARITRSTAGEPQNVSGPSTSTLLQTKRPAKARLSTASEDAGPSSCRKRTPSPHTTPPPARVEKKQKPKGKAVVFAIDLTHSDDETTPALPAPSTDEHADDSVPSSQSQHIIPARLPPKKASSDDFVPSSQSQYLTPPSPVKREDDGFVVPPVPSSPVQRDDEGFVVPSSQSQWLSPVRKRPEHDVFGPLSPGLQDDEDVVVPSSQSQWLSPVRSRPEHRSASHYDDDEVIPSSQSQFETELMPLNQLHWRTSSKERQTPVDDRSPDLADIFQDPLPAIDTAPPESRDESATESDDDDPTVLPLRTTSPVRQDSDDPRPTELSAAQSVPGEEGGSLESAGSSLGSLPGVVKDFYDMLGGDGSYPASFPQSLQHYTQDD